MQWRADGKPLSSDIMPGHAARRARAALQAWYQETDDRYTRVTRQDHRALPYLHARMTPATAPAVTAISTARRAVSAHPACAARSIATIS